MKPEDDMNIILVGKRHGKSRTVSVNAPVLAGAVLFVTALLVLAGWSGYKVAVSQIEPAELQNRNWSLSGNPGWANRR